ncbi:MAG: VCBS repeat-containing protein [Flavobacterium sp.]|nr:VCBS repeat-containing protein [Pedobacter sp.]
MHLYTFNFAKIFFLNQVCFIIGCFFIFLSSCTKKEVFKAISSEHSGINFNNLITESDSINVLDFANIYNGGGVGIGDFNNDSLQDIYFAGNMVSNKLYLNKGDFKFEDITKNAGVTGNDRWCRGVAVVDINNDGWQDMYVCASIKEKASERQNLLYVNQGLDKDKNPVFKEMAKEYGLNDTTYSTMASFFDYDNDGDLDCYITVNDIVDGDFPNRFRPRNLNGEHPSTGRLYRNELDQNLNHAFFTDVSREAGILIEGYGHNAITADFNKDGWKDIYVSNDYLSGNILYINNRDGTFTDKVSTYFKHAAANAMGSDFVDMNNDGLSDLIELDMNPENNYRKKMMTNGNSYQTYQNIEHFKYQYQYVRNMLQINQGPTIGNNDSIKDPIFSDVSFYAGVAETDWSWTPLATDFDNDGLRDLIITNGFPKDVTDHDFITFRNGAYAIATKQYLLEQIPAVKIPNYAYKNNGDMTFSNVSKSWGLTEPSFSNGAVYADLDNDGDMDVVVNNINDKAFIYKNTTRENDKEGNNYIQVRLKGEKPNQNGFGAWVEIYFNNGKHQIWENNPYRGYLSSMQNIAHFGLGKSSTIDSLIISWPNEKRQILQNVKGNQVIELNIKNAKDSYTLNKPILNNNLFRDVTQSVGINYTHEENDFIDFNIQKLLPHKFSEYGPALAVGDLDGNGLDDIISGGSTSYSAQMFLQQANGKFIQGSILSNADMNNKRWEDLGVLLFDADNDNDLDIYIASGGYENDKNNSIYQDKLYLNDGKANFKIDSSALPQNYVSKLCVRANDYDRDGDLDLFVSGRVEPWNYPKPVSSFIFRNDSKGGKAKFTDVTKSVAKELLNIGLVCDAVFTDFDNDGWEDLILAGEWMPVTFLKNDKGVFKNSSLNSGVNNKTGWWNTIAPGDFDNDGDIDYIVGNQGSNSFYRATEKFPAFITAKDFDNNGSYDAIPSLYLPDENGDKKEFPAQTRDDLIKQVIGLRNKFQNYKSFAQATMDQLFSSEQMKGAMRLSANYVLSSYFQNNGNGKFSIIPLPFAAQVSMLNGIVVEDFDGDGNLDLVINGNDYGTEVSVGRYDALNGLMLKGDGKGNFKPLSILESGIFVPGNGKALVNLKGKSGKTLIAASQNRGPLKIFELKKPMRVFSLKSDDESIILKFKNGKSRKQEMYYGYSFLSQSSRTINASDQVSTILVTNSKNQTRKIL